MKDASGPPKPQPMLRCFAQPAQRFLRLLLPAILLSLAACGQSDDGTLDIAVIDDSDALFSEGVRLTSGAQHLRAATRSGLVALDDQGEVVPALADRWNVVDEGRIFVFRLREGTWPDGRELTAESVRAALVKSIGNLKGTSLALDLAPVEEVRAMAGRVVELRLSGPSPYLLNILAQPELGLVSGKGDSGPMTLERDGLIGHLSMRPPEERGLPEDEEWEDDVIPVTIRAVPAERAIALFEASEVEMVLNGRIGEFPLADTGPLSLGTVRLDIAIGLFGLQVRRANGVLSDPATRGAIAMAIDREALLARFNIGGWSPTTRVVSPGLPGDAGLVAERWQGLPLAERRAEARARIDAWRANGGAWSAGTNRAGEEPGGTGDAVASVSIALGEGPGHDQLFTALQTQLATIGIGLDRKEDMAKADLVLVDRTARYASPLWFLNQFNCTLKRGLCSEDADFLVGQANVERDPASRANLLAEAETRLTAENVFIPIAAPLRWSLLRGTVNGFVENAWAFHPLPPMATITR